LKTTKKEEFFNTDQIEYCDEQIKLLIEMNEDEDNVIEKKLNIEELFTFLSKIEGRKSFFQRLISQYTQFKTNHHIGQINSLVFSLYLTPCTNSTSKPSKFISLKSLNAVE
jgi:hypothetical protein